MSYWHDRLETMNTQHQYGYNSWLCSSHKNSFLEIAFQGGVQPACSIGLEHPQHSLILLT